MAGASRSYSVHSVSAFVVVCLAAALAPSRAQVRLGLQRPEFQSVPVISKGLALPTLAPGASLTFTEPDAVDGSSEPGFAGAADFVTDATPLRAYAYGILPVQSSAASVFQYNDVIIAPSTVPGSAPDGVVAAQISGTVSARGFLFAMGATEARAAIDVDVLDVTLLGEGIVLASQRIAQYGVESRVSASIGGGTELEAQAGFPYVGVAGGGSIEAGVELDPVLRFVRDDVAFGFRVLVQRGHTIRVRVALSMSSEVRLFGGTAIACFFPAVDGGPFMPNPFDPDPSPVTKGAENSWLSLLSSMAGSLPDLQIEKGAADLVSGSVDVGGGDFEFASVWDQSITDVLDPFGFMTGSEENKELHGHDLLDEIFATPPLTMEQLVSASPFLDVTNKGEYETVAEPGVALLGPTITLDSDRAELEDLAMNRVIEENLARGSRLASMYLPAGNGGALERCMAVVSDLIDRSEAAGLETAGAEKLVAEAEQAQSNGKYKTAYRRLHEAYVRLTRGL